jgi:hypothetical protein
MTSSQRASAVKRKRQASNVGPKPTNVATFTKRTKKAKGGSVGNSMIRQAQRNYRGSYISGDLGGVKVSNPSLAKYYGKKILP